MLELFALGTIWFWALLFVVAFVITALVENEKGFWATVTLIGTVVALNYVFKLPVLKTITAHPFQALAWVVAYYCIGAFWGLFKWYLFVHRKLGQYQVAKAEFLQRKNATELTPDLALELQQNLAGSSVLIDDEYVKVSANPPQAGDNKARIIRWMSYWPFSIVGTLLNDFVRRVWNHIYTWLVETYDRVAAHVFRGAQADLELAKQAAKKALDEGDARSRRASSGR